MTSTPAILNNEILNRHISDAAAIESTKFKTYNKIFPVNFALLRVFDAIGTNLPATAASDDLGWVANTLGTDAPTIQTSDAKNTTVTQKARGIIIVPDNYIAGEDLDIIAIAGMKTTIASASATIDFSAYEVNDADATVGSDLVTTGATTINSTTAAAKTFEIDESGLTAGDMLDVLITIAITDVATATAVIGRIIKLYLACDCRG